MTIKRPKTATYTIVVVWNRAGWYDVQIPAFPKLRTSGPKITSQRVALLAARQRIGQEVLYLRSCGEQPPADCLPEKHMLRHGAVIMRVRARIASLPPAPLPLGSAGINPDGNVMVKTEKGFVSAGVLRYTIVITPGRDGFYDVTIPAFPKQSGMMRSIAAAKAYARRQISFEIWGFGGPPKTPPKDRTPRRTTSTQKRIVTRISVRAKPLPRARTTITSSKIVPYPHSVDPNVSPRHVGWHSIRGGRIGVTPLRRGGW